MTRARYNDVSVQKVDICVFACCLFLPTLPETTIIMLAVALVCRLAWATVSDCQLPLLALLLGCWFFSCSYSVADLSSTDTNTTTPGQHLHHPTTATRTSTSTGTISEMLPTMLSVEKCSVQPSTHCLAARKRPNPHSHGLGVALWGEKFRVPPQPSILRPCRPKPSTPGISKRTPQRLDLLREMLGAWIEVAHVSK